jgi:hypothetical protein
VGTIADTQSILWGAEPGIGADRLAIIDQLSNLTGPSVSTPLLPSPSPSRTAQPSRVPGAMPRDLERVESRIRPLPPLERDDDPPAMPATILDLLVPQKPTFTARSSPVKSKNLKYWDNARNCFICPHCSIEIRRSNSMTRHINRHSSSK